MIEPMLLLPLALMLIGALLAGLYRLPALNRRLTVVHLSWILALAPAGAFAILLDRWNALPAGGTLIWRMDWAPSLGLRAGLHFDPLSALFALMVTGIGVLVVLYTGSYFQGERTAWRFLAYLFLFMFAMLGLVLAGDLISLFIFWEATSVTSFLLVAYKTADPRARQGAFQALLLTAGGGVALLIGLLAVGLVAGSVDLVEVLASGDRIRGSELYLPILALVALGAMTKSAQFPFHFWLPGAMTAPTPASAYLHSATMVKAGIYLLARLNPAIGLTEAWFWLFSLVGLITMLVGAYLGLKQNDLKALLAYSTISQLGVMVMLVGQDTDAAFKALVIGVLAHALYKSALFLVAGMVDLRTGTRDLRRLGGLWRAMPAAFVVGSIAALSMAGLPPLFGFLAKETLLATATHPTVPPIVDVLFPAATVLAGAFLLAQAGLLIRDTFLGAARDGAVHDNRLAWWVAILPGVPAFVSLALGVLPEPEPVARLLAGAARASYGAEVKVSLALWTGLNVPLVLSGIAIGLGSGLFLYRARIRALQARFTPRLSGSRLLEGSLRWIDWGGSWAIRLQIGRLRAYLAMILITVGLLSARYGRLPWPGLPSPADFPDLSYSGEVAWLRVFALLVTVGAALATIVLRRDLSAILAFTVSGFSVALWQVLEPAPDVALVQVVVDILTMVVLALALTRLPRRERRQAWELTFRQSRAGLSRDVLLAAGSALLVFLIAFQGLASRPRPSRVTPFYQDNAKILTGAKDVVGAIIVDFRALDTLIEIGVFGVAGLAVYSLLRLVLREASRDPRRRPAPIAESALDSHVHGIGGQESSPFVHALAYVSLPLALLIAVTHLLYGHDQPGDGFTAGVIVGLAVGFWYVVFGPDATRRRLNWLRPIPLVAAGISLAVSTGALAAAWRGSFFAHVDIGQALDLPLMRGFNLSTAFLFEVAICLTVLGSLALILDAMGGPGRQDTGAQGRAPSEVSGPPDGSRAGERSAREAASAQDRRAAAETKDPSGHAAGPVQRKE